MPGSTCLDLGAINWVKSGCSSMAELQPSKLVVRVRFPSPAHRMLLGGQPIELAAVAQW